MNSHGEAPFNFGQRCLSSWTDYHRGMIKHDGRFWKRKSPTLDEDPRVKGNGSRAPPGPRRPMDASTLILQRDPCPQSGTMTSPRG